MIVRPQSILLDAEALSALAHGERRMQAWTEVARRTDSTLYASTATLAEVGDGTQRDARIRHVANAIRFIDVGDVIGFRAGAMRAGAAKQRRKARDLTVDALVAATAAGLPEPQIVVTADLPDMESLLHGTDVKVLPI
ncbi:twitching motility protein PilT [Flexivirga sp. ID2601S]|uniref:Twitching motility protein PilT n=1 Tax=Flexivirga aerilata TaxID=1656889 RepID=A0A849AGG2_9MICO|nr:PIN domain-containing protein [Flexivirga aerilata]NNG38298.1 twitching motility protein PilT [Flexivirga aerilata]